MRPLVELRQLRAPWDAGQLRCGQLGTEVEPKGALPLRVLLRVPIATLSVSTTATVCDNRLTGNTSNV